MERHKQRMSILFKALGLVLLIYVLIVVAAWLGQRRLMYVPDATPYAPQSLGLTAVDVRELRTPDGARLVVWRAAAQPGRPILLYLHGNAGGLATRADRIRRYQARGIGIAMMSYRGYSGSTGYPTEAHNVADAILLLDTLVAEGIKEKDIVLYGESLGAAVAVQVAARRAVGGLILDAPFTSMTEMATRTYPFLPVRPLLADRYDSIDHITRVTAPLLVLHGERDELIPVAMGRAMHAAARAPKEIAIFPNGLHTDLDQHGAVDVVERWLGANGLSGG